MRESIRTAARTTNSVAQFLGSIGLIWTALIIGYVFLWGSEPARSYFEASGVGWAYLGAEDDRHQWHFEPASAGASPVLERGSVIRVRDGHGVNLRAEHFKGLTWIFGPPAKVGELAERECARVDDVRRVAWDKLWMLVSKIPCPSA